MRRVFSIIAWTTGAFFGTAIVAALAAAFATGVLTYLLVWGGSSGSAVDSVGWAALVLALIFSLAVACIVLALGLRGRLPGTRLLSDMSHASRTIGLSQ
jgi:hypothetical protein